MADTSDPLSRALEKMMARCSALIRHTGLRHGLDQSDLDEVFQEVRVRCWRALSEGERIAGAASSYVYRTAASAALDLVRQRRARREEPLWETGARSGEQHGRVTAPDQALEQLEVTRVVTEELGTLAERRAVAVRMYLAGYTTAEIGEILDWTEGKARNLVYRGLEDLRQRLAARGIGPEAPNG